MGWSLLTTHARVLVCVALDPDIRLRDIASTVGVTERTAYGIVAELTKDGYVVKERDGRRNRYRIQAERPLRESMDRDATISELLAVLVGSNPRP
jgi:predicted transcriptional regulator